MQYIERDPTASRLAFCVTTEKEQHENDKCGHRDCFDVSEKEKILFSVRQLFRKPNFPTTLKTEEAEIRSKAGKYSKNSFFRLEGTSALRVHTYITFTPVLYDMT